jgi:hypothetical protein
MRKLSVLKTEGFFSCCAIGQKYLLNAISSNKLLGIFEYLNFMKLFSSST